MVIERARARTMDNREKGSSIQFIAGIFVFALDNIFVLAGKCASIIMRRISFRLDILHHFHFVSMYHFRKSLLSFLPAFPKEQAHLYRD